MKTLHFFVLLASLLVLGVTAANAKAQLPFERKPIEYSKSRATDPVALLRDMIAKEKAALRDDDKYGYLLSLLAELEIPASSQTLVFSKTSLQRHLISPSNPRAIYFNDDTYVAWIPNGERIEIASTDSMLGSVFYTVDQKPAKQSGVIVRRTERCLFCHGSSDTGRVPGLLMQSVYTNSDGNRMFPVESIRTDSTGPLLGRWGGWFVSGTHGRQRHLGNLMIGSKDSLEKSVAASANVMDLSKWFDVTKYLTPHSDIVALLVLQHQVTLHNLLTDANHRTRERLFYAAKDNQSQGREESYLSGEDRIYLDQIAEQVVDGLLMIGEARFSERITGSSSFSKEFAERGPADSIGRSLRQLDLENSLFQYPCSYLIYSDSFDALPELLLSMIYQRLWNVLSSNDARGKYSSVSASDRSAILQILLETKPNLPDGWTKG